MALNEHLGNAGSSAKVAVNLKDLGWVKIEEISPVNEAPPKAFNFNIITRDHNNTYVGILLFYFS